MNERFRVPAYWAHLNRCDIRRNGSDKRSHGEQGTVPYWRCWWNRKWKGKSLTIDDAVKLIARKVMVKMALGKTFNVEFILQGQ